ncbi:MAG: FABP family protein, partial [Actinomyces sp.]
MTEPPALHPDCSLLGPLVGRWRGRGRGRYPTIEDFAYLEELEFTAAPKPFVVLSQRTKDAATGEPLHVESGYLRPRPDGGVEGVIAQPTGITEV